MSEEKENLLKELKIEDFIWVIYLVIIGLSFYSNYIERIYIYTNSDEVKNKYRITNIIIFLIAFLIYLYFTYDNYKEVKLIKDTDSKEKKKLIYIEFIGSFLALIGGLLFLYAAIKDVNVDTEIAFN